MPRAFSSLSRRSAASRPAVSAIASALVLVGLLVPAPRPAQAGEEATAQPEPQKTIDHEVEAGEADVTPPRRHWVKFNEFDGPYSTFRWGFGFLTDFLATQQDDDSKQQVDMSTADSYGLRDFRLLFSGRLKTKRPISWPLGYMYDGADKSWRFRQTGFMIGLPEIDSRLFLGRTKEGYSLIKVMVGYYGWTMERNQTEDAFVPILADGAKLMTYLPKARVHFSLGAFVDKISENEKFSTADRQVVTRVVWQPVLSEENKEIVHLGVMGRYVRPDEGVFSARSRPGSYLAPYVLDTGKINADKAITRGVEAFWRKGPWMVGTEYNWQTVDAKNGDHPLFHGGEAVVSWIWTGETRPYNATGAYFEFVSPDRTVFEGGPGAWEAVFQVTWNDFDSGIYKGGKFWRLTPMINWYLSDNFRLEFNYGYSNLDRFGLSGKTQYYQARIQMTL